MIISNNTGIRIGYQIIDRNKTHTDGGTLADGQYIEYQPRGDAPYEVKTTSSPSISLTNVPSPDVIVTFWGSNPNKAGSATPE